MTLDKQKLRELANKATPGKWRNGSDPSHFDAPEVTDEMRQYFAYYVPDANNAAFIAAANPQAVLALLDENESLKRDGDALVREFHELSRTLNNIGWPSENVSGVARACRALRTLAEVRDSARAECERLRTLAVRACEIGEAAIILCGAADEDAKAHEELAEIRKAVGS